MKLNLAIKKWKNLSLLLILIFVVGLAYTWISNVNEPEIEKSEQPTEIEKSEQINVANEKYIEMSKGSDNAPVTFIEYASLTCPACAAFHNDVYPKLRKEYIETGKVKFIHREIYFDRAGLWAALTARCTDAVKRYFGMLDLLYSEQPIWSRSDNSDKIVEALLKISAKSGIGKERAISCLENQEKALDLVNQYKIYVNENAIESTPTFVINGEKYSNMSYEEIKEIIEKELKN